MVFDILLKGVLDTIHFTSMDIGFLFTFRDM